MKRFFKYGLLGLVVALALPGGAAAFYKNVAGQNVCVTAWNTVTNGLVTGDSANIDLFVSLDGAANSLINAGTVTELDATDAQGVYCASLSQADSDGDELSFTGTSTTTDVILIPQYASTSVATEIRLAELDSANLPADVAANASPAEVATELATYDGPTNAEMVARTILSADYFDPAADAVANVTLVATTTANTDMRGTDSAALASVATEARLSELDAANLPTDVAANATPAEVATELATYDGPTNAEMDARTLLAASYFDPATDAVANVTLVATTTANTDMRGTDNAALASVATEARLSELDAGTAGKMANQMDVVENDTTAGGAGPWTTGGGSGGLAALANGVAQGGTATTIQLAATETMADNEPNDNVVNIIGGTGKGQSGLIDSYVGATDTATMAKTWVTSPDNTSVYEMVQAVGEKLLDAAAVESGNNDALVALHLDHVFAVDYDPAAKPGVATALLNELVEDDVGVSRYTINALEQAPSGGGSFWDSTEQENIRDALGVTGTKTAATGGQLQIIDTNVDDIEADTVAGGAGPWTTGAGGDATLANQTTILARATELRLAELDPANLPTDVAANATPAEVAAELLIYDGPTHAELDARTILAADYFDPAADVVANVTLVGTTTANTDMRGTDSAALASVATEARLAELDAANLPADLDSVLADTSVGGPGPWTTGAGGSAPTVADIWNFVLAELSQGVPAATPTVKDAVMLLYMAMRNEVVVDDATTEKRYTDDAGVTIWKKDFLDDGTSYTEDEAVSGP